MIKTSQFTTFLDQKPVVIFAGAMGTELQRRGYKTKLPLWSAQANLDAAELVAQIHHDYFAAGAHVGITNTFRTTPRAFRKLGREGEAKSALQRSVSIAMDAQKNAGRKVFVGGSFAPLEDCYRPDIVPSDLELEQEHGTLASWLANEGVDFLLAETVNNVREATAMSKAASSTGLPFMISFVVTPEGHLLDGTPLQEAVQKTDFMGRVAVSINCRPIDVVESAFGSLRSSYAGVIGVYPNGVGCPHDDLGWIFNENDDSIEKFVTAATRWKNEGAKIIGGCCGTTPEYIRAISQAFFLDKAA
jgi:S-methylmethionine-dependent homocysteine/selenocysteine methylase